MEMHDKAPWTCPGPGSAGGMEGTTDALVLFRLLGNPFNATALWLLKVVAVRQPDLF